MRHIIKRGRLSAFRTHLTKCGKELVLDRPAGTGEVINHPNDLECKICFAKEKTYAEEIKHVLGRGPIHID